MMYVRRKLTNKGNRHMRIIRLIVAMALVALVAACAGGSKFKTYNGPEVTQVVVNKGARKMYLLHHGQVLKDYRIALGWMPKGGKRFQGDGKTPEGMYFIDRRNPNSKFHLSIGISYPNANDVAFAKASGLSPGGDIFIHGNSRGWRRKDWTWGCIAVTDDEIEDIYAMVKDGTPIMINP